VKLWQKIFLTTLSLVIVVVNASSLILLKNNHDLAIVHERQTALTRHSYLVSEIQNSIVYKQLVERTENLNGDQINEVLNSVFERQNDDMASSAALYFGRQATFSTNTLSGRAEAILLALPDYSSTIVTDGNKNILLVVSSLVLNQRPYQLITSYDITSTYTLFDADFNQIRIISIVSALIIAGILLLLVRTLLHPLQNLSSTTRQIASGNLKKRVRVQGNDEVAEVAQNLNLMADSIEQSVTALKRLAESRQVFIGNLTHEMKTPLTSILGLADLLRVRREVSDNERQEFANIIVNETKRLQGLSGKLMELLSVGSIAPTLECIDLQELSDELDVSLQPVLATQHATLVFEVPEDPSEHTILADQELLQSLIYNLVDNAIKASGKDSTIIFRVQAITLQAEKKIRISIIDNGIGIPADQIQQLTEPFYMLDKARTRKHGGAGLGLALCYEIAKSHGSNLLIQSELGEGTCASVDFEPYCNPSEPAEPTKKKDKATATASATESSKDTSDVTGRKQKKAV